MHGIAKVLGAMMLAIFAWPILAHLVPHGFDLMVFLLPLLWRWRNALDDGKDPLGESEQQKANWIDELEQFANTGKNQ